MVKENKESDRPPTEYTVVGNAGSRVITIECVFSLNEEHNLDEILEKIQETGAAAVMGDFFVKEHFDEASRILWARRMKFMESQR